jgi:hypothetical protein
MTRSEIDYGDRICFDSIAKTGLRRQRNLRSRGSSSASNGAPAFLWPRPTAGRTPFRKRFEDDLRGALD